MQKATATDQYWLSYGSASFDYKTCHCNIKLHRAITWWILVCCCWFLHENAAYDAIYCWCNRGVIKKRGEWTRRNIVAWRNFYNFNTYGALISRDYCLSNSFIALLRLSLSTSVQIIKCRNKVELIILPSSGGNTSNNAKKDLFFAVCVCTLHIMV